MIYDGPDAALFHQDVLAALKRWNKDSLGEVTLATSLPSMRRRLATSPDLMPAGALRRLLRLAVDTLRLNGQAQYASLIEERFVNRRTVAEMCRTCDASERSFLYQQEEAIDALARVLWTLEFGDPDVAHPDTRRRRSRKPPRPAVPETQQAVPPAAPAEAIVPPLSSSTAHLPNPSYSRLFGVEGILAQLEERLNDPKDHWLISIEGMGGLGKTAVAREVAGRLAATNRFDGIAWITAKNEFYTWQGLERSDLPPLTFEQLLDSIVDQLESGRALIPAGRAKQDRARTLLRSRPYLVIVDNLEAIRECEGLPDQLWALANPSKFLLTSRHQIRLCSTDWVTVSSLSLNRLAEPDAAALLRYDAGLRDLQRIASATDEALRPILAATEGNPLAIKIAVGQLVSLPMSRVLALLEPGGRGSDPFFEYLYHASWELLSLAARQVVRIIALLPASGAGWEDLAALAGLPDIDLDGALRELLARSLVTAGELDDTIYTLHPLTRRFVSSQPAQATALREGARRVGEYYLAYARQHVNNWPMLARRLDHILQAIELCVKAGPEGQRIAIECARMLGKFMQSRGNLHTWLPYLELALQAAGELGDEAAQADLWNQKGMLIGREGDLNQVLALHRRAADVFDRLQDPLNQARSLRWIGNVYYTRAERARALECYLQARSILEGLPSPDPREMSNIYHNIACVYTQEQDWARGVEYFERAEALLDPERDQGYLTYLLGNLGELYENMGCWRQAIATLERALPLQHAAGDVVGEAWVHRSLCLCYAGLDERDKAILHGRQAAFLYTQWDTPNSRAELYTDLAAIHAEWGEIQTARGYLSAAEPLWHQVATPDGICQVRAIEGDLLVREGEWARAEAAYREVLLMLADRRYLLPLRCMTLLGLCAARLGLGDTGEAELLLSQALAVAAELKRPDLEVRVLWLRAEIGGAQGRPALEKALAVCAEGGAGNDRLEKIGRQTQSRLNDWEIRYGEPTS